MAPPGSTSGDRVRFDKPLLKDLPNGKTPTTTLLFNESVDGIASGCKSPSDEILIAENGDYFFDDEPRLPFVCEKVLGKGHNAYVEKVQHTGTKEIFARKVITFRRGRFRARAQEDYGNEVDIIRNLQTHRHIIQLFAAYTTKPEGCLLLQPAADEGNLEDYLENYTDAAGPSSSWHNRRDEMTRVLEQAFGCLATGLVYIHQRGIRHKDIKPQNILIHQGFVIYTDFGAPKDTNKDGECTTEGLPDFLTRKYAPPEVIEHEKRNFAADVYSLGCVFIDVIFALSCFAVQEHVEEQSSFQIMDSVHAQLRSTDIPLKLLFLLETIILMTARDPAGRLDAKGVVLRVYGYGGSHAQTAERRTCPRQKCQQKHQANRQNSSHT
jgi:serine/threonine protein kinase